MIKYMKTIKTLVIAIILTVVSLNAYSQPPLKKIEKVDLYPLHSVNKSYYLYRNYVVPSYSNHFYYNQYFQHNRLSYPQPVTFYIRLRKHY